MDSISSKSTELRVWIRRILAVYFMLFVIGIAFYAGMHLNDLLTQPMATAIDIGWSALGALIVGLVFALAGAVIAGITFVINDVLNGKRADSRSVSHTQKNQHRNSQRIHYTATH
jgi:hypothetical protein